MRKPRRLFVVVVLAMVLAACAPGAGPTVSTATIGDNHDSDPGTNHH